MGEEAKRSKWKGCLLIALGVILLPILLLAAYIAWGVWANGHAESEAAAVCAAVKVGDPRSRVVELSQGEHEPGNFFPIDEKGYRFIYYGMIFHASECQVMITADRVVSKEVVRFDD